MSSFSLRGRFLSSSLTSESARGIVEAHFLKMAHFADMKHDDNQALLRWVSSRWVIEWSEEVASRYPKSRGKKS